MKQKSLRAGDVLKVFLPAQDSCIWLNQDVVVMDRYVRTLHCSSRKVLRYISYRKLAPFIHCRYGLYMSMGKGVLQGRVRVSHRPFCSNHSGANGGIHSARQFRTFVGSGIDANHTERRKLAFCLSMTG